MNAFEMINTRLDELEDAKGNHSEPLTVRSERLFLEAVSFKMEQEAARLALKLRLVNSFRAVEYRQSAVMDRDHCTVPHHQYDEHEQLDL
jgi:hypothetical protein